MPIFGPIAICPIYSDYSTSLMKLCFTRQTLAYTCSYNTHQALLEQVLVLYGTIDEPTNLYAQSTTRRCIFIVDYCLYHLSCRLICMLQHFFLWFLLSHPPQSHFHLHQESYQHQKHPFDAKSTNWLPSRFKNTIPQLFIWPQSTIYDSSININLNCLTKPIIN